LQKRNAVFVGAAHTRPLFEKRGAKTYTQSLCEQSNKSKFTMPFKKNKKSELLMQLAFLVRNSILLILALACSFRLLLTLYAGLFVMLSLAKFGKNAGSGALTLKATQSTVEGFALFQLYFCHVLFPSPRGDKLKLSVRR
jgi:flagellar biosynthesis protein FliP